MKKWFLSLPLLRKQLILLLCVGLLPMLIIGQLSYRTASQELEDKVFDGLEAVRGIKTTEVARHFQELHNQLTNTAMNPDTRKALAELITGFNHYDQSPQQVSVDQQKQELHRYYQETFADEFKKHAGKSADVETIFNKIESTGALLQYAYIKNNTNPLGSKSKLDTAADNSGYSASHALYHPVFRRQLEKFGYYDMFLVDAKTSNVVYTVFKELDFASNLQHGPWAKTALAEVYKASQAIAEGESVLVDFSPYTPSYDNPAAFIASPIFIDGVRSGALIIQIPIEPINAIMQERSGMGKTGESYLVGSDYLMRSDSFLDPKQHSVIASFAEPGRGSVKTEGTLAALAGKTDRRIIIDYNKNPVLSVYSPFQFANLRWAVMVEIDESEAFQAIFTLRNTIIIFAIGIFAIIVFIAVYSSRLISRPVLEIADLITQVQRTGNYTLSINNVFNDEIGTTTRAFNAFIKDLANAFGQINAALQALSRGEKAQTISQLFSGDLGVLVQGVNAAAAQIETGRAEQARQSARVEESAEQARISAREAQAQANQTMIVKQALDVCGTAVMIADKDFNLIYANQSLDAMLADAQDELRKQLPHFDSRQLLGKNMDIFHKSPQHQRQLIEQLHGSHQTRLKISGLTFDFIATPIRNNLGEFFGAVVEWKNITQILAQAEADKQIADENARIRQALDCSSTSTMIADADFNIIYMNHALTKLMQQAEMDIRQTINGFSAAQLVGKNMDVFHKNAHQTRQLLSQLNSTFSTQMSAGSRTFTITSTPIKNTAGARLGAVVEWQDRTAEVAIEKEIDNIIAAASLGDFTQQLITENKNGFFQRVSVGLNGLLSTTRAALQDIIRVLGAMATGDLSQRIEQEYQGQFALLKRDANTTIHKLNEVINGISEASLTIATSAREISAGTTDLSARTEEQAASLEQTAASMEEIMQIVRKSQKNAITANQLTQQTCSIAKIGDESVGKTAESMRAINDSSVRIANIIGVIDEIAFQTNLLALNAAVEAARAGELGRGFAVVAGEVRNLSQRSASAAREIKSLIADSGEKIQSGTRMVGSSRENLQTIVKEVLQLSEIMFGISISAKEQTLGIEQVNVALLQLDQITQQNAALVEEASAASEAMADQARSLDDMLGFFRRH